MQKQKLKTGVDQCKTQAQFKFESVPLKNYTQLSPIISYNGQRFEQLMVTVGQLEQRTKESQDCLSVSPVNTSHNMSRLQTVEGVARRTRMQICVICSGRCPAQQINSPHYLFFFIKSPTSTFKCNTLFWWVKCFCLWGKKKRKENY